MLNLKLEFKEFPGRKTFVIVHLIMVPFDGIIETFIENEIIADTENHKEAILAAQAITWFNNDPETQDLDNAYTIMINTLTENGKRIQADYLHLKPEGL